jgi:hypothetical protein
VFYRAAARAPRALAASGEELPLTRYTLEGVHAAIVEGDPRAHDKVLDRVGYEDLARPRSRRDPGSDMHGDAPDVAIAYFDFPGVQTGAHLESDRGEPILDRLCAPNRSRWPVEDGEEPVAHGAYFAPLEATELRPYRRFVLVEHRPPGTITHVRSSVG